jgi:hypothetical protein
LRALREVGAGFFDDAPYRVRVEADLPRSRERVFAVLGAPEPWPQWLRIVRHIEYTTELPRVASTRRDLTSLFGMTIREHFFRWDDPAGFSFYVYESNIPGLAAFAEHYVLEATGGDGCRLVWRTAFDVASWARPFGGVARAWFEREARLGVRRLASWLVAH